MTTKKRAEADRKAAIHKRVKFMMQRIPAFYLATTLACVAVTIATLEDLGYGDALQCAAKVTLGMMTSWHQTRNRPDGCKLVKNPPGVKNTGSAGGLAAHVTGVLRDGTFDDEQQYPLAQLAALRDCTPSTGVAEPARVEPAAAPSPAPPPLVRSAAAAMPLDPLPVPAVALPAMRLSKRARLHRLTPTYHSRPRPTTPPRT